MTPAHPPYFNRELSWIAFNRRVLGEALDTRHPLLERVKFLAIFATNLDEFFMVRVSGVRELVAGRAAEPGPDGLTPQQTLIAIKDELEPLIEQHARAWTHQLKPELATHGVHVLDWAELSEQQRAQAADYFRREVHPVLTPLAVDTAHPFPHISNLSLSLGVILENPDAEGPAPREKLARVKVPPTLPRLVQLSECVPNDAGDGAANGACFAWLDQIIAANIGELFPGVAVRHVHAFRVTRDTDLEIVADEAGDLLAAIENQVRERRFGVPVRLEIARDMPEGLRNTLVQNLQLQPHDVYPVHGPLHLADLMELLKLPLPKLKDPLLLPRVPAPFQEVASPAAFFDLIRRRDLLLFHPYDSFNPVVEFIRSAAADELVLAIKITLYRVGKNSPVVRALIDAVEKGKQVAVMVELKARFDEENNIYWAREMEDAGVHVVYGFSQLKVHAKVALVVRREPEGIKRYVHLGTGNYNAATARIYTDVGYFTADDAIGQDATDLFNFLTGYSRQSSYRKLAVAPVTLRPRLIQLIDREIEHHKAHGNGHLMFKVNALVDTGMIDAIYRASQAGVKVDLIVRGICCLRPGVPGLSETVRVLSIVGRFLEHSRVYAFHNNGQEEVYLASADLMDRNLDRRIEVMFPLGDGALKQEVLRRLLALGLEDTANSHALDATGEYHRLRDAVGASGLLVDSQLDQLRFP